MRNLLVLAAVAGLAACARPAQVPEGVRPTAAASASPQEPACPAPGVRIEADRGDAALGYREMSLHITNCGAGPVQVQGRPEIAVLGRDRETLDVAVVPSVHHTEPAHPVSLAPGQSTTAVMSWRNTVTDSDVAPVSGVYLQVAPAPGAPWQLVRPPAPLDLGNTGRLEVSVWL
ncbi:DUF4232 domain-containing protein [Dactylosporangium sp. CA-139066]|uniref:DUF4232 domain-containing protein n=1 Tax=Dactylosporangium sp. CA-139066 TaxID=3239930 RepID=UPI003D94C325